MPRHLVAAALAGLLSVCGANAQRLSPLAPAPDWGDLDPYQETITRDEFARLLDDIYAPRHAAAGVITIGDDSAVIRKNLVPGDTFRLHFAKDESSAKSAPRYWRPKSAQPPAESSKPLAGIKIAIDPGHLGGDWAKMEERWFQIGDSRPVAEGDLALQVASLLVPQLADLGAWVSLVRSRPGPTTSVTPESLHAAARADLALDGHANPPETYSGPDDPERAHSVQFRSELLFFRTAEIRHRAQVVNEILQPDLVICLHFNADEWGDPRTPTLTLNNHLHALINGTYSAGELRNDDVRHDMLLKLLQRSAGEELAANTAVVDTLARRLALPPYIYTRDIASRPGPSPYVWARNLLANRLYHCPVVFLEPYVMNSREVSERVQAGDYDGERLVAGSLRQSLVREYAVAVAAGLRAYFQKRP